MADRRDPLFDAVTDGNCLFLFVPRTSITVPAGKALTFDIGWLSFGAAPVGIWSYRSPTT